MKGWTKRRVALILVLAMMASQMSACTVPSGPVTNENPVSNNAAAVEKTETPAQELTEEDDWLKENLENIRESLLNGDYAQVVELLLGNQDQYANDAEFNALLYIAYMGNGNETEAAELLNNPNLDTGEFTDAFLDYTEDMKDNDDMSDIQRGLMNHMLTVGESNPEAYAAVARIGASIQNDDPNDPTAYAARYIAALAAGDEAAARAILAQAEANGITAEDLKTTAIEQIEQYNLTNVTVEQVEKGMTTSTTYNAGGNVVKSEVTVDNKDGTETKYIENSDGEVVTEVLYDKATGNIIKRTDYTVERSFDKETGAIIETLTGAKKVIDYENGEPKTAINYDEKGETEYSFALASDGTITAAYNSSGAEVTFPDEVKNAYKYEFGEDGELLAQSAPKLDDDGNLIGKSEATYDYTNPVGLATGTTEYEYDGTDYTKIKEINVTYTFDNDVKADHESASVIDYDTDIDGDGTGDGVKVKYDYEYENGETTKGTSVQYDVSTGAVVATLVKDYVNHTAQEYSNGIFTEVEFDESNTYRLITTYYDGDSAEGPILAKYFKYFEGTNQTAELCRTWITCA